MKIKFWGLLAFDVVAVYAITRVSSLAWAVALTMVVVLANVYIAIVVSPSSSRRTLSRVLQWASWTDYIPVLGGAVCICIAVVEFTWKPLVLGLVALGIGGLRIWSKGRVRQALRDRQ